MTIAKKLHRMFYKNKNELIEIQQNIKLNPCPHCGQYGTLILNGIARGYVEGEDLPVIRRHRVICNARRKSKKGCGGSITLYMANIIPHFRILACTLLAFASLVAKGVSPHNSFKEMKIEFHRRAATRWRNKIILSMSLWREKLYEIIPPSYKLHNILPLQESLNHFKAAFTKTKKSFMAYQLKFNCSVL